MANLLCSVMPFVRSIISDYLTVISDTVTYLHTVLSLFSNAVSSSLPAITDAATSWSTTVLYIISSNFSDGSTAISDSDTFQSTGVSSVNANVSSLPAISDSDTFQSTGVSSVNANVSSLPAISDSDTFQSTGSSSVNANVSSLPAISDSATFQSTGLSSVSANVSSCLTAISDEDTVLSSMVSLGRSIVADHLVTISIVCVCTTVYAIVSIIDGRINKVPNTGDSSTKTPVRKHVCRLFDTDVSAAREVKVDQEVKNRRGRLIS
ncbi:Uncharacterised protein r2_g642 [Pycnogonum litorale]